MKNEQMLTPIGVLLGKTADDLAAFSNQGKILVGVYVARECDRKKAPVGAKLGKYTERNRNFSEEFFLTEKMAPKAPNEGYLKDARECVSISRKGLEALLPSLEEELKAVLPYNWQNGGRAVGLPHRGSVWAPANLVGQYARMGGFVRSLNQNQEKLPWLMRALRKGASTRGLGSSYNNVNMWRLNAGIGSPWRANKICRAVHARARQILEPFGLEPCQKYLSAAVERGGKRVGKGAAWLALYTAQQVVLGRANTHQRGNPLVALATYRGLKAFMGLEKGQKEYVRMLLENGKVECLKQALDLVESNLVFDSTHGVEGWVDKTTTRNFAGVSSTILWLDKTTGGYTCRWLVNRGGNATHVVVSPYFYSFNKKWKKEETKSSIKEALRLLDRQEELARFELARKDASEGNFPRLNHQDYTVLVTKKDSLDAGNCIPGTDAFLRKLGFQDCRVIPARYLLQYAANPHVKRLLVMLEARAATQGLPA